MPEALYHITIDKYATDFLERVFMLLIACEEEGVLISDEIQEQASHLREFLDDHGRKLFG